MSGANVGLHYFEDGKYIKTSAPVFRPTHFDKIVVSSIFETTPISAFPDVPSDSVRNIARNGFYACKKLGLSVRKPVTMPWPVLDMRIWTPHNMAHLLLDIIPIYLHAKHVVGPELRLLSRRVMAPFSTLLNIFQIYPVHEDRRVSGNIIKVRATRGLSAYDLFGIDGCNGISFVPEIYSEMDFASPVRVPKVFMARRAPRNLENQVQVEALVDKFGYETRFFEDYPVRDQLSIGSQAKHVIAVHGAAMSFLATNKRIDSVIELLPPNVHHGLFPICLGSRVSRYEQIIPEVDRRVAHSGWEGISHYKNRQFSVNLDLLEQLLSEIH